MAAGPSGTSAPMKKRRFREAARLHTSAAAYPKTVSINSFIYKHFSYNFFFLTIASSLTLVFIG